MSPRFLHILENEDGSRIRICECGAYSRLPYPRRDMSQKAVVADSEALKDWSIALGRPTNSRLTPNAGYALVTMLSTTGKDDGRAVTPSVPTDEYQR